ncbi:MAG TPA: hypothetical protein VMO88_17455 [Acidimicrobiales bacterium]|jgi:uncharacterized membrane protein|nr:hypothetical protein [Acidimicrobiales bacterium]
MIKAIEFVFAWMWMWILGTLVTGSLAAWPLVFVALVVVMFFADKRRTSGSVVPDVERVAKRQQQAEERLARDCRALANAEAFGLNDLTDEAIAMLCNPN